MSDAIQPCPGRTNGYWQPERECNTCRRYLRPDASLPALKPQPEPCGQWMAMPGVDYVD